MSVVLEAAWFNDNILLSFHFKAFLGEYFMWFWILFIVHAYFNLVIKVACSPKFRRATVLQMMIHSVECVSMPAVFRDWDMDDGSVEDHRHRHKKVMVEMTLTIIVRFHTNLFTS